jgi:hypothetical protein
MRNFSRLAMFLFVLATLIQATSCAWFQKNEPKFVCVAENTITDLPELVTIITQCAAISVSTANIVPCIQAAAGSKWPEDVIACVANAEAAKPAVLSANVPGLSASNLSRLREAVTAKWGQQLGLQ